MHPRLTFAPILVTLLIGCGDDVASLPPILDMSMSRDGALPELVDALPQAFDAAADMSTPPVPFGPCERNGECLSGYCVPGPNGERVCSDLCRDDEDCPEEWECRPVANTRPDTVFICVARRQVQCLACAQDSDCGSGIDRCIPIGRSLRCARDCATEECPDGHTCQTVDVEGEELALCQPDSGTCAPCVDMDGDGFGNEGDCPALDCDDTRPETHVGAPEICDDLDNDCDTRADEGVMSPPEGFECLDQGICEMTGTICDDGAWQCLYPDGYEEGSESLCDGLDNDCDGPIDEDFDFTSDPLNCSECGVICDLPHAQPGCRDSICVPEVCEEGWHNIDGIIENGCEYGPCIPAPDGETCDGQDNDCDGEIDEGFAEVPDAPDALGLDENCDGVDGDVQQSVFVAPGGDDRNQGFTPDQPLRTIQRAIRIAAIRPDRGFILAQVGVYRTEEPVSLIGGIALYSGYGPGFAAKNDDHATIEIDGTVGMRAIGIEAPTSVHQLDIVVTDRLANGEGNIGLLVKNSGDHLSLHDCSIRSGAGGVGVRGDNGFAGRAGVDGADAAGSRGGVGGVVGGGTGATGRRRAAGPGGQAGNANGAARGGTAGSGSGNNGLGCSDGDPRPGGNGGDGANGPAGSPGSLGVAQGVIIDDGWRPVSGRDGTVGGRGGGGGGGGAGGGEDCVVIGCIYCGTGRGGGGGGGGGEGGGPGRGGTSGGASIGVLIDNSTLQTTGILIESSAGGDGGDGGQGGAGGPAGSGGSGVNTADNTQGDGGDGGDGGLGGIGGCGGSGSGGSSISLWVRNNGSMNAENPDMVVLRTDQPGTGGSACNASASPGLRETQYTED